MPDPTPINIGHRGARGHLPENTLPSFDRAISLGCSWVELDVYLVNEVLIVIHDKRVDRTTNGTGELKDLTLDYIRSLDAGDGAKVPTLNEVIEFVDHRCHINIELKGAGTAKATSRSLNDYLSNGWQRSEFLISSFNHKELAEMDDTFLRGALFAKLIPDMWERAELLSAWSVNFDKKDVSQDLVNETHSRGYKFLVYTVNSFKDLRRMVEFGVDGIFTDYPDRLTKVIEEAATS